jgi:hypothetical protein
LLLDREIAERHDRRLKARLRFAKLRHQASVEDIDWRCQRPLNPPPMWAANIPHFVA